MARLTKDRVKLTLSVKDSTKQLLQECAGGPRKVGVLIDRLVEELLTRSKVRTDEE